MKYIKHKNAIQDHLLFVEMTGAELVVIKEWLETFIKVKTVNDLSKGLCGNIEKDTGISVDELIEALTGTEIPIERMFKRYAKNREKYKGKWLEKRVALAKELIEEIDGALGEFKVQ